MAELRTRPRPDDTAPARSDEDILRQARERMREAIAFESVERRQQWEALEFRGGKHWDAALVTQRSQPGQARPCLVVPRQEQFIKQITNEERRNPQSVRVNPVDSQADVATARILQGIIRHIEVASRADMAFATAYDQAVGQGLGYVGLMTDYVSPQSFDQEITIRHIGSRFDVYLDPASKAPDGLDAEWGFVVEKMSRTAFCAKYNVDPSTLDAWGERDDVWMSRHEVQIAEYWYKEYETYEIALLADGTVRRRSDVEPWDEVVDRRRTQQATVWFCKINGYQILSRTKWLGRYIPLIPVVGNLQMMDGQMQRTGMIQPSADSQRRYNYLASAETEAIALAPRAPFVGYADVFEGFEREWQTANTHNHAYLPVRLVQTAAGPLPLPQRLAIEPAVQAITQARMLAADDIKATLGMYVEGQDPRLIEQSGVAIEKRRQSGQTANYQYPANLAWARRALGVQLLDLIPQIHDREQVVRMIGEDGQASQVTINGPFRDGQGMERLYQLGVGRYDCTVSSGPAYETQRQEAAASMDRLMTAFPAAAPVISDLFVANLDVPQGEEMAARLKTLVPPEALQATATDNPADQLAMMQNELMQTKQNLQALNQYAQGAEAQLQAAQQQIALLERSIADAQLKLDAKGADIALKDRQLQLDWQEAIWTHEENLAKLGLDATRSQNGTGA